MKYLGNYCEIDIFAYNYFFSQYSAFSAVKIACKTNAEENQVCGVGLIPGLHLFHCGEYRLFFTNYKVGLLINRDLLWNAPLFFIFFDSAGPMDKVSVLLENGRPTVVGNC